MKTIQVAIEGLTPLLMNNPASMLEEKRIKSRAKEKIGTNHKAAAEKCAYMNKKGLFIPASAIKGAMLNGASWKKAGKVALKPLIAGATRIEPYEIPLGTKKYEIDLRTVVIQRQRVVKARPKVFPWKASFNIVWDNELLPNENGVRMCLEDAGKRIGLLDFRPQKGGEFGMFKITKWKVT